MKKDPNPERKKIPMKTRLIIIVITFVIVNVIFYFVFDSPNDSEEVEKIEQEAEPILEEPVEEEQHYKFNPPKP